MGFSPPEQQHILVPTIWTARMQMQIARALLSTRKRLNVAARFVNGKQLAMTRRKVGLVSPLQLSLVSC